MSRKGLKLLKLKRTALILEFFNMSKTVASLRSGLQAKLARGYEGIHNAEMFVGPLRLEYESMRIPRIHQLTVKSKNVMGVRIPELSTEASGGAGQEYLVEVPVAINQSIKAFQEVHQMAIENVLIPRLEANARYIKLRFDEMERESFTKLKNVKRKMAKRKESEHV